MSKALIYGHRGARGEAPENTLEGFAHALQVGVAGFETDISLTADFVPVLHHNPDLPDGRFIRDVKCAELSGIPTLAEALRLFPAVHWLLEIKTFPPHPEKSHPPAVMVEATLAVIASAGIDLDLLTIMAFDWSVLREVAARAPHLRRACLTAPDTEAARSIWWGDEAYAGTAEAVAATGAGTWTAFHGTLSEHKISEARACGLKILTWTVNDLPDYQRLSSLVDIIITDFPTRFIRPPP